MKIPSITIVLASLAGASSLYANGGGYADDFGWTGDFSPTGASEVEMVSEDLTIYFGPDEAVVEVEYELKNRGPRRQVEIGFPCTTIVEPKEEEYSDASPLKLLSYTITKDGEPVRHTIKKEKAPAPVPSEELLNFEMKAWVTKWHVSKLSFKRGESAKVRVRFRQGYQKSGTYASDDGHHSAALFSYTLSSAAVWKGPIKKGKVTLIVDTMHPEEFQIEPRDRFERKGNTHTWNFKDLEPTAADDLRIRVYGPYSDYYVTGPGKIETKGDWQTNGSYELRESVTLFGHNRYEATASSTLAPQGDNTYDAKNVADWDKEKAWVEGAEGDGVGESLTLRMKTPLPVHHVSITPGYTASERLWAANNRVAKLKITANGEKSWNVDLPDRGFAKRHRFLLSDYAKPVETLKQSYVGNMGFAIICLTLIIKSILFPL
ncbi:MAG: DUF4424 family protein, partial [Verrucomicrobiota bacterium]